MSRARASLHKKLRSPLICIISFAIASNLSSLLKIRMNELAQLPLRRYRDRYSKTDHSEVSACAAFGDTASTMSSTADDYGECDASLMSYRSETLHQELEFPSRQEASGFLFESLRNFGPCSDQITKTSENGRYCFFASGHEKKIEINIRSDLKAIVFTTVVHEVKHSELLHKRGRGRGTQYSLMTKMMKFNTLLNRASAGQIGSYEGRFVFFRNLSLAVLRTGNLSEFLEDYILKAVEVSLDFALAGKSKTRRLPFI